MPDSSPACGGNAACSSASFRPGLAMSVSILQEPASAALEVVLVDDDTNSVPFTAVVLANYPAPAIQTDIVVGTDNLCCYRDRELHAGAYRHIRIHLEENSVCRNILRSRQRLLTAGLQRYRQLEWKARRALHIRVGRLRRCRSCCRTRAGGGRPVLAFRFRLHRIGALRSFGFLRHRVLRVPLFCGEKKLPKFRNRGTAWPLTDWPKETYVGVRTMVQAGTKAERVTELSGQSRSISGQNLVVSVKLKSRTFMAGTTMSKDSSPEARAGRLIASTFESMWRRLSLKRKLRMPR